MGELQKSFTARIRRDALRRLLVPVLAVLIWTAPAGQTAKDPPPSPDELQQQLNALTREKADVQRKLHEVKIEQRRVTRQLNAAQTKVNRTYRELTSIDHQLDSCEANLLKAERAQKEAQEQLDGHKESLGRRLEIIYQQGDSGLLEMLVQANSYGDLANRFYLLNELMAQDASLLQAYEQARLEMAQAKQEAENRRQELVALKRRIANSHASAVRVKSDTAEKSREVARERVVWERALAELEQNSKDIESMILRFQNTKAGRDSLIKPFSGSFIRPVRGRISSAFGMRRHPILKVRKMHTGVDIAAPSGTLIKAAASGNVIHSGRWGGYGNCVIIDHGGGVATLYAHCSRMHVSVGSQVAQGDIVGRVGQTSLATGPHLHFEVRRNGKPVNPGL